LFTTICEKIQVLNGKLIDLDPYDNDLPSQAINILQMFKDEEGRTIKITKDFLDEGMTIEEVISDHLAFGDTEEEITVIEWREFKSGTTKL